MKKLLLIIIFFSMFSEIYSKEIILSCVKEYQNIGSSEEPKWIKIMKKFRLYLNLEERWLSRHINDPNSIKTSQNTWHFDDDDPLTISSGNSFEGGPGKSKESIEIDRFSGIFSYINDHYVHIGDPSDITKRVFSEPSTESYTGKCQNISKMKKLF